MARPRNVISTKRPSRSALESLPREADDWVRNPAKLGLAPNPGTGPDAASDQAATEMPASATAAPATPQPSVSPVDTPPPAPPGSVSEPERSTTPAPQPKVSSPESKNLVKFTLDVPLNLHRAMKIQSIKRSTTIVATARTILGNYYGRSAEVSPGEYRLQPGEKTRRLTLDLDKDLHTEMRMQKVLREANIQAEVLQLLANHYLPGEVNQTAAG